MSKVSKVSNTILYYEKSIKGYNEGVESGVCGFLHNTVYRVMVLMSEVSKVYSTLFTGPLTPPREKVTVFEKHLVLWV